MVFKGIAAVKGRGTKHAGFGMSNIPGMLLLMITIQTVGISKRRIKLAESVQYSMKDLGLMM